MSDRRLPYSGLSIEDMVNAALVDEALEVRSGPALDMVLRQRAEQILRHGHDREADAMLALDRLPREARTRLGDAIDQINAVSEKQNLPLAYRNLARTAAICMAAMDRLSAAIGRDVLP